MNDCCPLYPDSCVCATIREIVKAQNKVIRPRACENGCEQSIRQLLSPEIRRKNKNTTIPFILFKKECTKPLILSGVKQSPIEGYPSETFYECIKTPVLRVIEFVNKQNCCVNVELLRPVNANGCPIHQCGTELCDFFSTKTPCRTIHFRKTGICLTIDLNDYSTINCLKPIKPLPICQ